jgi:hypothetical protein
MSTQPTSPAPTAGWAELLALAERELALLRGGDAAALPAAIAERARLAARVGAATTAERPLLERLAGVQHQILAELALARDEVVRELGSLQRGRGAVQGYRAAAGGGRR